MQNSNKFKSETKGILVKVKENINTQHVAIISFIEQCLCRRFPVSTNHNLRSISNAKAQKKTKNRIQSKSHPQNKKINKKKKTPHSIDEQDTSITQTTAKSDFLKLAKEKRKTNGTLCSLSKQ